MKGLEGWISSGTGSEAGLEAVQAKCSGGWLLVWVESRCSSHRRS